MTELTARAQLTRWSAAAWVLALLIGAIIVAVPDATAESTDRHSRAGESAAVAANKKVVLAFLQDVLNEHHGDHAASYFTADMTWHGGTVGTVPGRDNVAGLLTSVVQAIPDLQTSVNDVFGQGDKVVVRLVVSGTQTGPMLGIPATGRHVAWDAIDVYRLEDRKIAEEWAAEDFTALLRDTGTYKALWIP
jgi:steroid delta-isomerase-like uncharacterized protein